MAQKFRRIDEADHVALAFRRCFDQLHHTGIDGRERDGFVAVAKDVVICWNDPATRNRTQPFELLHRQGLADPAMPYETSLAPAGIEVGPFRRRVGHDLQARCLPSRYGYRSV
nr:hypothetical protein [Rhodomicrobium udaipurense]